MELRHLRSFLALADELHFGRAAERLGIAQPPLSRHIQLLEAEIGAPLFERSPRAVTLTAAGKQLAEKVRSHVEAIDDALRETRAVGAGQRGRLRVGCIANLSYFFLPRLLELLRERAPDALLELHDIPTPLQLDALREGRIDLGFASMPIDDPGLMRRGLFEETLFVAMKADHALALRRSVSLAALADEPFILCPRYQRQGFHEVILDHCARAGFKPKIAQMTGSKPLLAEMIVAGLGLSIVPESAALAGRPGIAYRRIADAIEPIEVAAIWRREYREPLLRRVLDVAVAVGREIKATRTAQAPALAAG